jgi:hypothetical protein
MAMDTMMRRIEFIFKDFSGVFLLLYGCGEFLTRSQISVLIAQKATRSRIQTPLLQHVITRVTSKSQEEQVKMSGGV